MIVSVLLLLPISLILIWAYWYLLPRHGGPDYRWYDSLLIVMLIAAAGIYMRWALTRPWSEGGDIVPQVMAVAGAYTIFAFGLLAALFIRRRMNRS